MAFWGATLIPNEPYTLQRDDASKRLRITQATLGDSFTGLGNSRNLVRCTVGSKPPILICALSTKEVSSRQLDLEFEECDNVVFLVTGSRSVHLAGYLLNPSCACTTSTNTSKKISIDGKEYMVVPDSFDSSYHKSRDMIVRSTDDIHPQICDPRNGFLKDNFTDKVLHGVGDGGNEASLAACITDEKRGPEERSITLLCNNRKDADYEVGVAMVTEKICQGSGDLDKIPAGGFRNRINQSTDEIVRLREENRSCECFIPLTTPSSGELLKCNSLVLEANVQLDEVKTLNNCGSKDIGTNRKALTIGYSKTDLYEDNENVGRCATDSTAAEALDGAKKINGATTNERVNYQLADSVDCWRTMDSTGVESLNVVEEIHDRESNERGENDINFLIESADCRPVTGNDSLVETAEHVSGSSISQENMKKIVKPGEGTFGMMAALNPLDYPELTKGCAIDVMAAEALVGAKLNNDMVSNQRFENDENFLPRSVDCSTKMENDALADMAEQISGLSIPKRKKKKKVKHGEETPRMKASNPPDLALIELPKEKASRKKKKKIKGGEGTSGKSLNPPEYALKLQTELPKKNTSALLVPQRKKIKKVRSGEVTPGQKSINPESPNKCTIDSTISQALFGAKRIDEMISNERFENDKMILVGSVDCITKLNTENGPLADISEQVSVLTVLRRKKKKKVKTAEGTHGMKALNPPGHAMNLHSVLPGSQVSDLSVSLKKKRKKVKLGEGTHQVKDPNPLYCSLKLHPELTNEKVNGLSISHMKNQNIKTKKVRDGEDTTREKASNPPPVCALELHPELANGRQDSGSSVSKRKKKMIESSGEDTLKTKVHNPPDHVSESNPELPNEQVNDLSVTRRKKKRKVTTGEGTPGEKTPTPPDPELPNEPGNDLLIPKVEEPKKQTKLSGSNQGRIEQSKESHRQIIYGLPALSSPVSTYKSTASEDTQGKELKNKKKMLENAESEEFVSTVGNNQFQTMTNESCSDFLVPKGEEPNNQTNMLGSSNQEQIEQSTKSHRQIICGLPALCPIST